ncbi:hypothetical protein HKCCA1058_05960 [Rhodobacterales bacterium HKCCA1058]|nr:hypothetical protein [Rhodobacterales bacterium HKCCA1058]
MFSCTPACAFDIAKAHAFINKNKRTALVASAIFLQLNGWHLVTDPADIIALI